MQNFWYRENINDNVAYVLFWESAIYVSSMRPIRLVEWMKPVL